MRKAGFLNILGLLMCLAVGIVPAMILINLLLHFSQRWAQGVSVDRWKYLMALMILAASVLVLLVALTLGCRNTVNAFRRKSLRLSDWVWPPVLLTAVLLIQRLLPPSTYQGYMKAMFNDFFPSLMKPRWLNLAGSSGWLFLAGGILTILAAVFAGVSHRMKKRMAESR